jgi:hypothetical protein
VEKPKIKARECLKTQEPFKAEAKIDIKPHPSEIDDFKLKQLLQQLVGHVLTWRASDAIARRLGNKPPFNKGMQQDSSTIQSRGKD